MYSLLSPTGLSVSDDWGRGMMVGGVGGGVRETRVYHEQYGVN